MFSVNKSGADEYDSKADFPYVFNDPGVELSYQ